MKSRKPTSILGETSHVNWKIVIQIVACGIREVCISGRKIFVQEWACSWAVIGPLLVYNTACACIIFNHFQTRIPLTLSRNDSQQTPYSQTCSVSHRIILPPQIQIILTLLTKREILYLEFYSSSLDINSFLFIQLAVFQFSGYSTR